MQEFPTQTSSTPSVQPIDRVGLGVIIVLGLLIGLLLLFGGRSVPRVRDFSWLNQTIGAADTAFIMTFNRPMDTASVEANLQIGPPLPGKVSWAGRRMAYTLESPAPYGTQYQLSLPQAQDQTGQLTGQLEPFTANFQTRDRAFAYVGIEGDEAGRLILYNLTRQKKQILTPQNMAVMDFKAYPTGDKLLLTANKPGQAADISEQQLYTVTTGLGNPSKRVSSPNWLSWLPTLNATPAQDAAGQIQLVLDHKDYQNLKFDLSANGEVIVVQRVSRKNPGEFGLWILRTGMKPQPLKTEPGGDFVITPDSEAIAMAQGEGIAILPLTPTAQPLEFLAKFGRMFDFSADGSKAAVLKFNKDRTYTRSLVVVDTQGKERELLKTTGSIWNATFDPSGRMLYCLLTQLIPGKTYRERPYIAAIDLDSGQIRPLLVLPEQRDIAMSLSPDGLALLLDQVVPINDPVNPEGGEISLGTARTADGKFISTSQLWLLPLPNPKGDASVLTRPEPLPLPGLHPQWLP
jgi:Bacterial Ig-like domain